MTRQASSPLQGRTTADARGIDRRSVAFASREMLVRAAELVAAGSNDEAERLCWDVIHHEPRNLHALGLASNLAMAKGDAKAAVPLLTAALRTAPNQTIYAVNLGEAYRRCGQLAEALTILRLAVQTAPSIAAAHYNLALALEDAGMLDEAIQRMARAIELQSEIDTASHFARMRHRLSDAQHAPLDRDAAVHHVEQRIAAESDPTTRSTLLRELATLHFNLGQLEEAMAASRRAMEANPASPSLGSDLLLYTQYHPGYDSRMILNEALEWQHRYVEPLRIEVTPHQNNLSVSRRLKIGYVSADFCHHVSTCFTWPLFSNHDHENYEIICYSDVKGPDQWSKLLRQQVDKWRDIRALSEQEVAQLVRQDRIDILFDLSLHISESRPLIFAHMPAPVQVCWLGYPGTTGQRAIDYRISDPYLDPIGSDESLYAERTVRLPCCFWCYHPLLSGLEVGPQPVAADGQFTFGALNSFAKVHDGVLLTWAKLLRRVPKSRLLMLVPPGAPRQRVIELFAKQDVAPNRVQFLHNLPRREYFLTYQRIDLALDPFPCNGHTTSMDALFMGVPIVTLRCHTVAGRAGTSLALNLGLPELVAENLDEYLSIAESATKNLSWLADLRMGLRHRMEASAIMDGARFARDFEALCRGLWRDYCRTRSGEVPG